jgi:hypothetical protein
MPYSSKSNQFFKLFHKIQLTKWHKIQLKAATFVYETGQNRAPIESQKFDTILGSYVILSLTIRNPAFSSTKHALIMAAKNPSYNHLTMAA